MLFRSLFANLWAPLILLFAHRLFTRGRWTDAVALAAVGALQLLESFYRVIGVSLLVLVYGTFLVVRYRSALPRLWPKLLFVALVVGAVAVAIFEPYLAARTRWDVLQGRSPMMLLRSDYWPRGKAWLGWGLLVLATVGILDRLRRSRPRDGCDPRFALLAAALLVAWCSVWNIIVPIIGLSLASPLLLLGGVVPGLDAVRALGYVWFEVVLVASLLAGYGVLALTEALRPALARTVRGVVVAAVLLELFVPAITATGFPTALEPSAIGVNDEQRALYARIDDGAVLDLPLRYNLRGRLYDMSYYAFLRGYHGRPAAACYNSYLTPVQNEVAALVERLPDPAAVDALHAMGFRWLVVHDELLAAADFTTLAPLFADASRSELIARARHPAMIFRPELDPGRTYEQRLYRLSTPPVPGAAMDSPS